MPRLYVVPRARRALARLARRLRGTERRVVRLTPESAPLGRVLLSYIVDPFLARGESSISYAHTQDWECFLIARTWLDLGFAVDVIHWTNRTFRPDSTYDVLVDPRFNLERLAPLVGADCLKIFHAETAHWRTNDEAQIRRLDELAERRGTRLTRTRLVGENHGIETAHCAIVLGNEWTAASYRPFGRPLFSVPLSNAFTYPSPQEKRFDLCRRRFLWFGGVGFVHKGLDLVLEAFAGAPDLELEIAAPLDREPDFTALFDRELYRTPNIRPLGWLDVGSSRFLEVANRSLGMVFPSCSEGGGGSAITTMHAGLIPVLSHEASVDLEASFGVPLTDSQIGTIRAAARQLAGRPHAELREMAVAAWRRANERHTRSAFRASYHRAAIAILERFRPELAERVHR